jgi:DNA replication protein DnaC
MTKKEILKLVFAELSNKRSHAENLAHRNKVLVSENFEFYELEKRERLLNMQIGKCRFENIDYGDLQKELDGIANQKEKVLKTLGMSPADLVPQYDCKKCGDTGVVDGELCSCVTQAYNNKLMEISNVNLSAIPYLADYDYQFFDEEKEKTFAKKCVKILNDYVNNFDSLTMKNIVMCGGSGTGKTYLTKCVAKELIRRNKTTLFISSFDLNSLFLEQHLSSSYEKNNLKNLIDVDALIIDDLGTEPMRKNVTKEYLLILLNERIAKGKSTITTTNLSPEQVLDKYEERIFSRLFNKRETLVMEFTGKNERLKK